MINHTSKYASWPADIPLSEHSRKFYDGTYKWDSEGFTDEDGAYRQYDCYDPAARAPTPLPPILSSDAEDEHVCVADAVSGSNDSVIPSAKEASVTQQALSTFSEMQKLSESSKVFTFSSGAESKGEVVTVRHEDLFLGHVDRPYLIGKMEGILAACGHTGTSLSLEACYRLCDIPEPERMHEKVQTRELTPPLSPVKTKSNSAKGEQHKAGQGGFELSTQELHAIKTPGKYAKKQLTTKKPSSCHPNISPRSDLSDCPSDLSDVDTPKQVRNNNTAQKKGSKRDGSDSDFELKPKRVKKGVAQKVVKKKKSTVRARASTNSAPILLSLQSGTFMRASAEGRQSNAGSRRRSSRFIK